MDTDASSGGTDLTKYRQMASVGQRTSMGVGFAPPMIVKTRCYTAHPLAETRPQRSVFNGGLAAGFGQSVALAITLDHGETRDNKMATQLQTFESFGEIIPRIDNARNSEMRLLLILREGSRLGPISADLVSAGYPVCQVNTWREVLLNFRSARPDLILLNVNVPDTNGKQMLRQLRDWTTAPVIVISAQTEQSQRIDFLDCGADDYVTKPFELGELLARIRAASRRAFGVPRDEVFRMGDLEVDFSKREVRVERRRLKLTATEYDLLKVLAGHAGQVRTHYQLIHEVWGGAHYQDAPHLLRVTVYNLRRKLSADSSVGFHVVTEPGIGYTLRCDPHGIQAEPPHKRRGA